MKTWGRCQSVGKSGKPHSHCPLPTLTLNCLSTYIYQTKTDGEVLAEFVAELLAEENEDGREAAAATAENVAAGGGGGGGADGQDASFEWGRHFNV